MHVVKTDSPQSNAIRRRRPDPILYDCNLTPQTQKDALAVLQEKYDHENPDSSAHVTLVELDGKLGPRWQMRSVKELEKPKARGEYMIYSLDNGQHKYLIWREQEKRTCCSCCFC
ncbi:unnamed protein product [Echinostoma caproni]|uniref:TFA2_Winged_2 domain-containing protein n=1 Tax=Echinostoma caproni TaxID=27848 RepID=A0A183AD29_9TREM|nr:unnamed protein product [Echinostoma caproni]